MNSKSINITKENLVDFCHKNQKYLFSFASFMVLVILGFIVFFQLEKQKYIDASTDFYQTIYSEEISQNSQYFQQIYKKNKSAKISALGLLNYAKILIKENQIDKAIKTYGNIVKNKSYDEFIRNFADFMQLKTMISSDYKKFDIEITDSLERLIRTESHYLKYHIFEQEAIFLLLKGNKKESYKKFLKLANPINSDIAVQIKNRAKIIVKNLL
jgi:predicted negative regulator of RcsB-dependent stress response